MRVKEPAAWVVYKMTVYGRPMDRYAVCTQEEWNQMEAGRPGHHALIRAEIGNEGVAERLARELQSPPEQSTRVKTLSSPRQQLIP